MAGLTQIFINHLKRAVNPDHSVWQTLPQPLSYEVSLHYGNTGMLAGNPSDEVVGASYARQVVVFNNDLQSTAAVNFNKGSEDWTNGGKLSASHFVIWAETTPEVFEAWFYGELLNVSGFTAEPAPLGVDHATPVFYKGNIDINVIGNTGAWLKTAIAKAINPNYDPAPAAFPQFEKLQLALLQGSGNVANDGLSTEINSGTTAYVRKDIRLDDEGRLAADVVFSEKKPDESWGSDATHGVILGIAPETGDARVIMYQPFINPDNNQLITGEVGIGASPFIFRTGKIHVRFE